MYFSLWVKEKKRLKATSLEKARFQSPSPKTHTTVIQFEGRGIGRNSGRAGSQVIAGTGLRRPHSLYTPLVGSEPGWLITGTAHPGY